MFTTIAPYAKAVVGFVAPAATVLVAAVLPDSPGAEAITSGEWITAACTAVITASVVYSVPNRPVAYGAPVNDGPDHRAE